MRTDPPKHLSALNTLIRNAASNTGEIEQRYRTVMALVIVGQMLPEGAVKGGSAMALRYGRKARFTRDLDVARLSDIEDFRRKFEESLSQGWEGFTGRLIEQDPPQPPGIPAGYVMQPFEVKLSYRGKAWCTVSFELGHNEMDDALDPEAKISDELTQLFTAVRLPEPAPVAVMRLEHQIAQKLHSASAPRSDRARDLVDLQLMISRETIDFKSLKLTCDRLFRYRQAQPWPPLISKNQDWQDLYESACEDMDVLKTVDEAVEWANKLIQEIDQT